MNSYCLTLLIKNSIDEKERTALLDSVKKNFDELKKEDLWGSKNLAYKIAKQDKAFYAYFEFNSDPSKISSLDKQVKLNEDIIRYLLLRKN